MEYLFFWLSLWLFADSAANPLPYQIRNFCYYDEHRKEQPLQIQNKVYIDSASFAAQLRGNDLVSDIEALPHGTVAVTSTKGSAIRLLNELYIVRSHALGGALPRAYPVVIHDGIECMVSDSILLRPQPSVVKTDLLRRLESIAGFSLNNVAVNFEGDYILTFDGFKNPSNVISLANLIAGDSAWVVWARPRFVPIYEGIRAEVSVSTAATTDLGEPRFLNIVVSVHYPGIKLRTDLFPASLSIIPRRDESWLEVSPFTVKEEVFPNKRVYHISYPFRYYAPGDAIIDKLPLPYEENGEMKSVSTIDYKFKISSVLNHGITDIQSPTATRFKHEEPNMPTIPSSSPYSFFATGIFLCVSSGLLIVVSLLLMIMSAFGEKSRDIGQDRDRLWRELKSCDINESSWRRDYMEVNRRLASVLEEFFGIRSPVSSATCSIASGLLEELEKLYQDNPQPDVANLRFQLKSFCER